MNVLVVGKGWGKSVHVPAFKALGCEVKNVTRDYDLDWADIVSVAVPPESQYEVASAAMRAGKDILCEKPLTDDRLLAQALARASHAYEGNFGVAYQFRKDIPKGKLMAVRWCAKRASEKSWKKDLLTDRGSHVFDYLRNVCGPLTVTHYREHDDSCLIAVEYEGGRATIDLSWAFNWGHKAMIDGTTYDMWSSPWINVAKDFLEGKAPTLDDAYEVWELIDQCRKLT